MNDCRNAVFMIIMITSRTSGGFSLKVIRHWRPLSESESLLLISKSRATIWLVEKSVGYVSSMFVMSLRVSHHHHVSPIFLDSSSIKIRMGTFLAPSFFFTFFCLHCESVVRVYVYKLLILTGLPFNRICMIVRDTAHHRPVRSRALTRRAREALMQRNDITRPLRSLAPFPSSQALAYSIPDAYGHDGNLICASTCTLIARSQ